MPSLAYISEYEHQDDTPAKGIPVAFESDRTIDQDPIDFTGGEEKSEAFATSTRMVRIHVTGICSIRFGKTPTATTNNKRLPADAIEYFYVKAGDSVSFIPNT